jgi:hypothetical protein
MVLGKGARWRLDFLWLTGLRPKEEFEKQLDWSPPSLSFLKVGDRQHLSTTVRFDPLPRAPLFPVAGRYDVFSPARARRRRQSTTLSVYPDLNNGRNNVLTLAGQLTASISTILNRPADGT